MELNNLSFKDFLLTIETVERKLGHLDSLEDELGIDPKDMEKGVQVSPFMSMGSTYNLSPYKIVGYTYENGRPAYAKVKIMNVEGMPTRKRWKKQDGKMIRIDDAEPDDKVHLIKIDKLEDLMTKGMTPPAGMAGGMGAPPPGGLGF